jgi:hypothetical protein
MGNILVSDLLHIGIRICVFVTLLIFINTIERNLNRAHVRGKLERLLEMIAAFIIGIVLRGLILLMKA